MENIIIFAGTTEGRTLAEKLSGYDGIFITAVTATEYGGTLIKPSHNVDVISHRLDESEMENLINSKKPRFVIDSTHPYALIVSENIKTACQKTGTEYVRLLRESSEFSADFYVDDIIEAGKMINEMHGNVLVTTGSKELHKLFETVNDVSRLFARVLPTKEVMDKCHEMGIPAKNIIAMQGPFTKDFNIAVCKMLDIKIMLSKDGGKVGGYDEKIECARELGLSVVTIGRNSEDIGISFEECLKKITSGHKLKEKILPFPFYTNIYHKKILVVGAGTISTRRVNTLLGFSSNITVVSKKFAEDFPVSDKINRICDEFSPKYLNGIDICLACTNDRQTNRKVHEICREKNIPHSICDKKEESSFFFPGIVIKDNVVVGVCGDGSDHKKTKSVLERLKYED